MKKLLGSLIYEGISKGVPCYTDNTFFDESNFSSVKEENSKLVKIISEVEKDLNKVKKSLKGKADKEHIEMLEIHLMILKDKAFLKGIADIIKEDQIGLEMAIIKLYEDYSDRFDKIVGSTKRQGFFDVADVCKRLLKKLHHGNHRIEDANGKILILKDLTASILLEYKALDIHPKGVVVESHGKNSHSVTLLKAFNIPSITGVNNLFETDWNKVKEVILDSRAGYETLIVNPNKEDKAYYEKFSHIFENEKKKLQKYANSKPITKCGKRIESNIMVCSLDDALPNFNEISYDGVGLFSTEFFFILSKSFPSENAQYEYYLELIKDFGSEDKMIGIRIADLGCDKINSSWTLSSGDNPALGLRGIRFSLHEEDMLRTQIKAILRAAYHGNIKISYPMITNGEEIIKVNKILEECKEELLKKKELFDSHIKIEAIIETPSSAIMIDVIIDLVDSVSIGVNDLTQYILATSRNDEKVSYLYDFLDSSVLRTIKNVSDKVKDRGKDISICGEMCNSDLGLIALLSLGIESITFSPSFIPKAKQIISKVNLSNLKDIREYILNSGSAEKNRSLLSMFYSELIDK